MGYYNSHVDNKQRKKSVIMPTAIGIIIGVLIAWLVLAEFSPLGGNDAASSGDDSENTSEEQNSEENNSTNENSEGKTVNVDVTSQVTEVVGNVQNTVVGVVNIQNQNIFGNQRTQGGTGSGVIYKKEGDHAYIVTNHHVIQGASNVEIVLNNEEQIEAELLGSDMYTDLAVLRVPAGEVPNAIEFGSSESLQVGEPVIAIGNPLGLQFAGSVTQGIISGKERLIPVDFDQNGVVDWQAEAIQTDAAINPGNSGGALVNLDGQLVGINSMKISNPNVEGLGFAIPIDHAIPIIEQLEEDGAVTRAFLGISPYSLSDIATYHWQNTLNLPKDVEAGVVVANVDNGTPAAQAGLEQYDVIVEFDGEPINNSLDLRKYLYNETEAGEQIEITFYRDGEKQTTKATLTAQEF
ncbi:S1C family serine protease [Allobacillus halotolerans]|uniref:Trypsin-like peptidase domain-containing protein n=1 Tax=Allobacillus halotolerans TaxID=570278 RepID=A0ABS6GLL5_9BACI|nr:trypsin-like peptidase domain-containing protein [Allobacillus halotolerans]MBU6080029.1 trypsin-like peptidase domain-containing protein [Allobacillus halotolerans]